MGERGPFVPDVITGDILSLWNSTSRRAERVIRIRIMEIKKL